MCTEMKITAGRMISNFDYDAFNKWCENKGVYSAVIARELGYNSSFFSNCKTRNAIKIGVYKSLLTLYGLPEGSFLKDEKEPVNEVAEVKVETPMPTVDLTEIVDEVKSIQNEIKELQMSINKLGNIMMQMLEYVGDIRKELK